ncbi:hypothetical protein MKX08_010692 [Trichoderma sp. CBMAI-0020]|nr:hypothetical protein MKX08_010692 [Trichoderma sp. CBMAI-0020]
MQHTTQNKQKKVPSMDAIDIVGCLIEQAMTYNLDGEEPMTKIQVEERNDQLEEALTKPIIMVLPTEVKEILKMWVAQNGKGTISQWIREATKT